MKEKKCGSCNEEIATRDAFEHDGETFCPECVAEHLKDMHTQVNIRAKKQAAFHAELELQETKHSHEAKWMRGKGKRF